MDNIFYLTGFRGSEGTLLVTNNLLSGNALVTFGSGSGGKLILGGSNYFPSGVTLNPIGVVQVNTTNALGGLTGIAYGLSLVVYQVGHLFM